MGETEQAFLNVKAFLFYIYKKRMSRDDSTRFPLEWAAFDCDFYRWVEFFASLLCSESFSPGTPI